MFPFHRFCLPSWTKTQRWSKTCCISSLFVHQVYIEGLPCAGQLLEKRHRVGKWMSQREFLSFWTVSWLFLCFVLFCFVGCFESRSYYVAFACLGLVMKTRLVSNPQRSAHFYLLLLVKGLQQHFCFLRKKLKSKDLLSFPHGRIGVMVYNLVVKGRQKGK